MKNLHYLVPVLFVPYATNTQETTGIQAVGVSLRDVFPNLLLLLVLAGLIIVGAIWFIKKLRS